MAAKSFMRKKAPVKPANITHKNVKQDPTAYSLVKLNTFTTVKKSESNKKFHVVTNITSANGVYSMTIETEDPQTLSKSYHKKILELFNTYLFELDKDYRKYLYKEWALKKIYKRKFNPAVDKYFPQYAFVDILDNLFDNNSYYETSFLDNDLTMIINKLGDQRLSKNSLYNDMKDISAQNKLLTKKTDDTVCNYIDSCIKYLQDCYKSRDKITNKCNTIIDDANKAFINPDNKPTEKLIYEFIIILCNDIKAKIWNIERLLQILNDLRTLHTC